MMFRIELISGYYRKFIDEQIAESWSGPFIAVHGDLYDTRTHPGYAAVEDGADSTHKYCQHICLDYAI